MLYLCAIIKNSVMSANRAERYGGKTMRVLADQNVLEVSLHLPPINLLMAKN
jgi:hypothetical protein